MTSASLLQASLVACPEATASALVVLADNLRTTMWQQPNRQGTMASWEIPELNGHLKSLNSTGVVHSGNDRLSLLWSSSPAISSQDVSVPQHDLGISSKSWPILRLEVLSFHVHFAREAASCAMYGSKLWPPKL
jgi:hypothetical protein